MSGYLIKIVIKWENIVEFESEHLGRHHQVSFFLCKMDIIKTAICGMFTTRYCAEFFT